MATFTIDGQEYPVKTPQGRSGRRAVSSLVKRLTKRGEDVGIEQITELFDDDEFETKHLPTLLGVNPDVLEKHGSFGEVLSALMLVVSDVFESMSAEEVQAAEKK